MPRKLIKRTYRTTRYILYRETLVDAREHFWAFVGSFVGLGIIAYLQYGSNLNQNDLVFLIGSFGASCVLVYGVIESPLAQPRNLIGGHLVSAVIGVSVQKLLPDLLWVAAPLAVSLSIIAMQITKTLHPPGGATALIAATASPQIRSLGYMYVLSPVLSGCLILLVVALIFNNLTPMRKYPSAAARKRYAHIIKRIKQTNR
ncbi:HPP family protein [Flavobacterium sp. RNTU_13]|uniref:HPP family protein n=1 Tax=Flavobacterium sp. RNTU_13 TaxID=3375145 RepID=UPI0039859A68